MGLFDNLKQTIAFARGQGDPSTLPPEQRAAVEAAQADAAARHADALGQAQQGYEAARAASVTERTFSGAAAAYLYGPDHDWHPPSPLELERIRVEQGTRAMIAASQPPNGTFGGVGEALGETVGRRKGPTEITDPVERERVATAERAARDAARAPYRAVGTAPLTISRIATHGDSQVEELCAFLRHSGLAARPDLVWGVSRVPDRIEPMTNPASERGRVVEWDVIHVPGELPPAPADPTSVFFSSREQWIARRIGEPCVLDEDVARWYLGVAGIEPQHCLGAARSLHLRSSGREESAVIQTWVEGVHVLHPAGAGGDAVIDHLSASAPAPVDLAQLPPAHIEVLEWAEVAQIVHPQAQHLPRVPNPVPSLPSTPQELLRAYVEVVGVQPHDCWSAQVTVSDTADLMGSSGMVSHNMGPALPCADGTQRRRLHGARHVVVAYRDRPEYAEGRARWQAYQRDVLEARLQHDLAPHRPPVHRLDADSAFWRAVLAPQRAVEWWSYLLATQPPPMYRYCWPPVDT